MTERERVERRRHLLARMAGNIAGSIYAVHASLLGEAWRQDIATDATDLAESILEEIERRHPDPPPGRPEPTSIPGAGRLG